MQIKEVISYSQIPQKSAARLFADCRGLTRTAKSLQECRGLSRKVLVCETLAFAERDFSPILIINENDIYDFVLYYFSL